MIKTHRTDPAFRSGTLRVLAVENWRVLAFVRETEGRGILCVNNLSRFAQAAEIDLSAWRGRVPVEVIGGASFPAVGERPYLFTLGPHTSIMVPP